MTIVVSGASGYLGQAIVQFLLAHTTYQVIGISRTWADKAPLHPRFIAWRCDLSQSVPAHQIKADVVIHLAAMVKIKGTDDAEVINGNVKMTAHMLQWARANGVKHFLLASSMTVYANGRKSVRLKETSLLEPAHGYGLSKLCCEHMLRQNCIGSHMQGTVVRLPGLFGGRRAGGLLFMCAKRFKDHENIALDLAGLGNWDFLHVDDAARTIALLLRQTKSKQSFRIFNAGYGDGMHLDDVLDLMRKFYQSRSKVKVLHKQDYCPAVLDVRPLKKILKSWPFSRRQGLKQLMQEVRG